MPKNTDSNHITKIIEETIAATEAGKKISFVYSYQDGVESFSCSVSDPGTPHLADELIYNNPAYKLIENLKQDQVKIQATMEEVKKIAAGLNRPKSRTIHKDGTEESSDSNF